MNQGKNVLLWIPAAVYGMVVGIRNFAYDHKLCKTWKSTIPTICVGNLSVGGSGKTPHIELLISLLRRDYRIAVLTRGYGRKGKKPRIATVEDDAHTIGDEPLQIKRKYPDIMVYVDGNRKRGLKEMEQMPAEERPQVVLMDDGFQHRSVTPSYSILLTRYSDPYYQDFYMPFGNLRDGKREAFRADTIIFTGTPKQANVTEMRLKIEKTNAMAYQDIFCSSIHYEKPQPLFTPEECTTHEVLSPEKQVMVISGIANPKAFQDTCVIYFPKILDYIEYPDHHDFRKEEIQALVDDLKANPDLFILTTEKDGMRFITLKKWIPTEVRHRIWILPISIDMELGDRIQLLRKAKKAIKHNGLPL